MTPADVGIAGTTAFLTGAFTGAVLLLAVLSVLIANAYGERSLLLHAAAMVLAVAALQLPAGGVPAAVFPATILVVLGISVLHVREVSHHVGALRKLYAWPRRAAVLLMILGLMCFVVPAPVCLALGLAWWIAVLVIYGMRAWPQSQPWAAWQAAGLAALGVVTALAADAGFWPAHKLWLAGLLAFWAMAIYLASVWRSRLFGENRWRQAAEQQVDPMTGLSTPKVLAQRVAVARGLMRRYGHPGSLLLVHAEQLAWVASEKGAQLAETASLETGQRIRSTLGQTDVAARVSLHQFALFSEGAAADEASGSLASRVVAAGLRAELPSVPGLFLKFRVVVAPLPVEGENLPQVLHNLRGWMHADVAARRHRTIRVLTAEELAAPPDAAPSAPLFT